MVKKIEKDYGRFREIIKGQVRKDLRKYITHGEMIGKRGRYVVSIPLPTMRIPQFRYGKNDKSGVGQGDGEIGTPIASGDPKKAGKQAGDQPGEHMLEVDITIEELAKILGEELELPKIKPKGKSQIIANRDVYTGIARAGPESLRHFKRTYKEALKRSLAMGLYNPTNPVIVPVREDRRYRSWKPKEIPQNNAVIIYMMDVSGSMGDEQKEIVRIESFWIDTWLRSQYQGLESRYIIHDATARMVDRDVFFKTRESGGTMISSAYRLCAELIEREFDPAAWNVYAFHFSDGDNWSSEDTKKCVELMNAELLPKINVFCYGQVKSAYGSGQFKKDLDEHFKGNDCVVTSEIRDKGGIYESIKDFLGKGK
jgi:hypothetical protein